MAMDGGKKLTPEARYALTVTVVGIQDLGESQKEPIQISTREAVDMAVMNGFWDELRNRPPEI